MRPGISVFLGPAIETSRPIKRPECTAPFVHAKYIWAPSWMTAGQRLSGRVSRLSTADFIAYEFILPRLSAFRACFHDLELNLDVTSRLVDFSTSDIDAA